MKLKLKMFVKFFYKDKELFGFSNYLKKIQIITIRGITYLLVKLKHVACLKESL